MRTERILRGTPASPGVAVGPVHVVQPPASPARREASAGPVAELARLGPAVSAAVAELEALAATIGADGHLDEAVIFEAQAAMAADPLLLDAAQEGIRQGRDAVTAVELAARTLADELAGVGDELLAARAADVLDVGSRIARHLDGTTGPAGPDLAEASIVAAGDLAPSATATLPRDLLRGLLLANGSPTAHASILARAYGIPAVVAVPGLLEALTTGPDGSGEPVLAAIDGTSGEVVIDPAPATLERFADRLAADRIAADRDRTESTLAATTRDGVAVDLLANIGSPTEARSAVELGASGVGLFRTEFLFMERAVEPTEAEQIAAYRAVLESLAPRSVTVRLLDAGADKPIAFLGLAAEANPFLGVRGIRIAAARPDVFLRQIRAALRAAASPGVGSLRLMIPMVVDARDVAVAADLVETARTSLDEQGVERGEIELGVMLEIPSAILAADSYFGRIAFASLGTNDLLQYTVAVDRGNPDLRDYQDPLHPSLLRLIDEAVQAARRASIDLSVCGEMAGDPAAALALIGLGVRRLSMTSSSIAAVRRAIRGTTIAKVEQTARLALGDASAAEVKARFGDLITSG